MSTNQYINSIPIFQGSNGKFYIVNGYKYDINFPLAWALNHRNCNYNQAIGSGPKECANCLSYGSINGVFVGYCSNCLTNVYDNQRGICISPGSSVDMLSEYTMWERYSYLKGVTKNEIGEIGEIGETVTITDRDGDSEEDGDWKYPIMDKRDNE